MSLRRAVLSWLLLSTAPLPARADDVSRKQACVDAHADAQKLVLDGKREDARARLASCTHEECPAPVKVECAKLLAEVDASRPRLAVEVAVDGAPSPARVTLDGAPWTSEAAIAPGAHLVRVEAPGLPPVERRLLLEAEPRRHAVRFELTRPPATLGAATAPTRPVPTLTWTLGGLGLASLGLAAWFAHAGRVEQASLQAGCAPACSAEAARPMRRDYLVADLGLAAAALSLGGAAWTFWSRPTVRAAVGLTRGGVLLRGAF